jgi:cytochrome c oxidase subunit 2
MKPSDRGKKLFNDKGCNACHSLDGSRKVGPSFLQLFGKKEPLEGGGEALVDENYIKESILHPAAKVVASYPPSMPSFEGQLKDEEIGNIIAFIRDLKEPVVEEAPLEEAPEKPESEMTPAERGEAIYKNAANMCVTCHSIDGSKLVGPSFKGLYGHTGKLADGSTYTADDAYIKKSIREPQAQTVEGFPATGMPAIFTPEKLSDEKIADLIEYFKTLK